MRESDIVALFSAFGPVTKSEMTMDPMTGRSKGFCFIEYADAATAEAAMAMDGFDLAGRRVRQYLLNLCFYYLLHDVAKSRSSLPRTGWWHGSEWSFLESCHEYGHGYDQPDPVCPCEPLDEQSASAWCFFFNFTGTF